MYELPKDFDPTVFVGACLELISFGVGSIHLQFNLRRGAGPGERQEATIVVYSGVGLMQGTVKTDILVGAYPDVAKLGDLLNLDVVAASASNGQTLRMQFEGGRELTFSADGSGYECYSIYLHGVEEINV